MKKFPAHFIGNGKANASVQSGAENKKRSGRNMYCIQPLDVSHKPRVFKRLLRCRSDDQPAPYFLESSGIAEQFFQRQVIGFNDDGTWGNLTANGQRPMPQLRCVPKRLGIFYVFCFFCSRIAPSGVRQAKPSIWKKSFRPASTPSTSSLKLCSPSPLTTNRWF